MRRGARETISRGPEHTQEIGRQLGERLRGGEVVLLFGPLGAGKTVFVRGLAEGMRLDESEVRSPSFKLIDQHSGDLSLYHVDLYRISGEELRDLGLEDLYGENQVVAVEWAERLEEAGWDLSDAIIVEIDYDSSGDTWRRIVIGDKKVAGVDIGP